ncbi:MAG: hypothetical protein LQ350_006014 [Teloschistes chrysophthalmus]|nr:MAG: hypothetical protein LQ350_006014 [Niorma chrysophthalma]
MALNPKNLTYDSNEPAFLRKLRGEYGGSNTARHQCQQLRPRKKMDAEDEDEDEPVYVHEGDPNTPISRADYDVLMKVPTTKQSSVKETEVFDTRATDTTDTEISASAANKAVDEVHPRQETATIGGVSRKRAARIIADDESADEAHPSANRSRNVKRQALKQGKKPKLSFQDE